MNPRAPDKWLVMPSKILPSDSLRPRTITLFGCGYVGSAVARQAIDRGLRVSALTRNQETASALRAMGVSQVVEAELDSPNWHSKLSPEQDYVVNCVSSAGGGLDGYRKSYLSGQESILSWARGGRIGAYLYTSSISVYPQSGNVEIDETFSTTEASGRGRILLESERLLVEGIDPDTRWFILRLAGIYGPGRHSLLDRLREPAPEITGEPERHLNLIHRDDVCSAIWAALEAPDSIRNEIFNVCDDFPETRKQVLRWLADTIGRPPPVFVQKKPLAGSRRSHLERPHDRRIINRKIKSILGWRPAYPSYQDGYRQILQTA